MSSFNPRVVRTGENKTIEAGNVQVIRRGAGIWDIFINGKKVGTQSGVSNPEALLRQYWTQEQNRLRQQQQQQTQPPAAQQPTPPASSTPPAQSTTPTPSAPPPSSQPATSPTQSQPASGQPTTLSTQSSTPPRPVEPRYKLEVLATGERARFRSGPVEVRRVGYGEWDVYHNGKLIGRRKAVQDGRQLLQNEWNNLVYKPYQKALREWERSQNPGNQPAPDTSPTPDEGGGAGDGSGSGSGDQTALDRETTGTRGDDLDLKELVRRLYSVLEGLRSGLIDVDNLKNFIPDKTNTISSRILDDISNFNEEAQQQALNTAFWNIFFQNANFSNPYYETKLMRDPETGQFTVVSNYNPAVQRAFNALYEKVPELAEMYQQAYQDVISQKMPRTPEELQQYAVSTTQRDFTSTFQPEQFNVSLTPQEWLMQLSPEDIDYTGTVADRQTVQDELFNLYTADIEQDYNKRKQELESRLLAEGISPYSRRYLEAMSELEKEKNRAINEARQRAVADSGSEMLRRLQGQLSVAQERFGQRQTIQGLQRQQSLDRFSQLSQIEQMRQRAHEQYQANQISAEELRQRLLGLSQQEDELRNKLINDAFARFTTGRTSALETLNTTFNQLARLVPEIQQSFQGTQKPHVDVLDVWKAWTDRDLARRRLNIEEKMANQPFVARVLS